MTSLHDCRVRRVERTLSTDDIIPGRYKHMHTDTSELATHVFENCYPGLAATFAENDVIYCTETFGIGSSREQAVSSLQAAGIRAVLAPAFGRIFYRNAWNLGLLAIEVESPWLSEDDRIDIDLAGGTIRGPSATAAFSPPPRSMLDMVEQGGLLAMIAARRASLSTPEVDP